MCWPQAKASKPTRRPRLMARSPSSLRSAAARSMPPRLSGDTLEHTSRRSHPSSCMTSNLRSARANTRSRLSAGMPSKSRNGWKAMIARPRSLVSLRTSAGVPPKESRSFSKISTPAKPAAAMASSFSARSPLKETVAIDSFMDHSCFALDAGCGFGVAGRQGLVKRAVHALKVRLQPGKEAERLRRLVHAHATTERRLNRSVDDVGDPKVGAQQLAPYARRPAVQHQVGHERRGACAIAVVDEGGAQVHLRKGDRPSGAARAHQH